MTQPTNKVTQLKQLLTDRPPAEPADQSSPGTDLAAAMRDTTGYKQASSKRDKNKEVKLSGYQVWKRVNGVIGDIKVESDKAGANLSVDVESLKQLDDPSLPLND